MIAFKDNNYIVFFLFYASRSSFRNNLLYCNCKKNKKMISNTMMHLLLQTSNLSIKNIYTNSLKIIKNRNNIQVNNIINILKAYKFDNTIITIIYITPLLQHVTPII